MSTCTYWSFIYLLFNMRRYFFEVVISLSLVFEQCRAWKATLGLVQIQVLTFFSWHICHLFTHFLICGVIFAVIISCIWTVMYVYMQRTEEHRQQRDSNSTLRVRLNRATNDLSWRCNAVSNRYRNVATIYVSKKTQKQDYISPGAPATN